MNYQEICSQVYNSKLRKQQEQALQFVQSNIDNTDNLVLELPVGVGKSFISYAIATSDILSKYDDESTCLGAYILTTSKNLQTQYIDDFGSLKNIPSMVECKSAQNYTCHCNKEFDCLQVKTLRIIMTDKPGWVWQCKKDCTYQTKKQSLFGKFNKQGIVTTLPAWAGVTNYKYLLNMWRYAGQTVAKRSMLIMDEAHNIEKELMGFVQIDFTKSFIVNKLQFNQKVLNYNKEQFVSFIQSEYRQKLTKRIQTLYDLINEQGKFDAKADALKMHEKYDRHLCKINRFLDQNRQDPSNWVFQKQEQNIFFRPIYVNKYAEDCLLNIGKKRLYMSATIGNPKQFANSIGLKDYKYFSVSSPFKKQNRKIYFIPCGKMTKDKIDNTLPQVCKQINEIVKYHKDKKGIIHSFTYKITNSIKNSFRPSKRLVTHQSSKDRVQALTEHTESKIDSVLLSPSLFEGIDLKDDLSRFQIICKVPYPNLGDQRIKIRCKNDYMWYVNEAVKSIVQAYGRSVRTSEDYADTFILDSSFEDLIKKNSYLFPKWFLQAIQ